MATQASARSGHNQALQKTGTIDGPGPNPALRNPLTACIHCLRLSAIGAWFINKGLDSAPGWPYFGKDKERAQNRRASWVNRPIRVLRRLPLITIDTPADLHRWTKRSIRWLLAVQSAERLQAMGPPMYVNLTPVPPPIEDPTKLLHALWQAARNLPDSVRPSRPRPTLPANPANLDASIAALEELLDWCVGSSVTIEGSRNPAGNSDVGADKPKKTRRLRGRTAAAVRAGRYIRKRQKEDPSISRKKALEEWIQDNPDQSFATVAATLSDHPDLWKPADKSMTRRSKS